jgi:hypothetical protein
MNFWERTKGGFWSVALVMVTFILGDQPELFYRRGRLTLTGTGALGAKASTVSLTRSLKNSFNLPSIQIHQC